MLPSFRNFLESCLPCQKAKPLSDPPPACVVILRTDMIGDHIIFGGLLERLRQEWPKTRLVLVAPAVRRELYDHCSCLNQLITYDFGQPGEQKALRAQLYQQIRNVKPDWIINSMYSRSAISDRVVRYCHAPVRIGFGARHPHRDAHSRRRFDRYYTHLVSEPHFTAWTSEAILQKALLSVIGISLTEVSPRIWTSSEDVVFAEKIYSQNGLSPERTIVYFTTASNSRRSYPRLREILSSLLDEGSYSLIALGSASDYEANHAQHQDLSSRWLNLCGQTTMAQSAEIMRLCRLVVGVDTGPMHAARAVEVPHVVLLGGMLFGRFFPNTTPLSSVVAHPLNCYFCEGECPYEESRCVTDISKTMIRRAIDDALHRPGKSPRIYLSRSVSSGSNSSDPNYAWKPEWLSSTQAEIISMDPPSDAK